MMLALGRAIGTGGAIWLVYPTRNATMRQSRKARRTIARQRIAHLRWMIAERHSMADIAIQRELVAMAFLARN